MGARRLVWLVIVVFLSSCSKEVEESEGSLSKVMESPEFQEACAALPTCAQPRFQATGPSETIWRIRVVREASGSIRFGRINSVEVTQESGVPVGPVTGDYLLAGVDESGIPVDGQMIQFPQAARIEFEGRKAPPQMVDLSGQSVSTTGYVRALPTVGSLAILDESGKTIATAEAPSTQASWHDRLPSQLGFSAPALAQPIVNTSSCSHVEILTADDISLLEYWPEGLEELVTPKPRQLAGILAGLGRMTPLLCQSVSTIAFGDFGSSSTLGMVHIYMLGDTLMINSGVYTEEVLTPGHEDDPFRRMDLQQTVVHEAGHAAEALLNSLGLSLFTVISHGDWPLTARAMADDTIERVRMKSGFGDEWSRVHDSFVELGWATDYVDLDDAWPMSKAQIAHSGFMSPYGASGHFEDIAEAIGWTYIGRDYALAGVDPKKRKDYACMVMKAHGDKDLPSHLAAIYTKLQFLKDLGLVAPGDVEDCTGSNLGLPVTTEGFEVWQGGVKKRHFDSGVKAGIGSKAITPSKVFTMKAEGSVGWDDANYPATMELHLDLGTAPLGIDFVPWPRGAYQFGSFWAGNNLMLRVDGASAGNWDAEDGFAVVTEASNDRIVGSIFLTRALRVSAPSPLPAYDAFNPPLIIRFLMQN